jgi:hypothetical protein
VRIDPGSDAGARVDDRQAFTPAVHVGDEGTVTVTFYDFRNNTAADGMLATDQWAVLPPGERGLLAVGGLE